MVISFKSHGDRAEILRRAEPDVNCFCNNNGLFARKKTKKRTKQLPPAAEKTAASIKIMFFYYFPSLRPLRLNSVISQNTTCLDIVKPISISL